MSTNVESEIAAAVEANCLLLFADLPPRHTFAYCFLCRRRRFSHAALVTVQAAAAADGHSNQLYTTHALHAATQASTTHFLGAAHRIPAHGDAPKPHPGEALFPSGDVEDVTRGASVSVPGPPKAAGSTTGKELLLGTLLASIFCSTSSRGNSTWPTPAAPGVVAAVAPAGFVTTDAAGFAVPMPLSKPAAGAGSSVVGAGRVGSAAGCAAWSCWLVPCWLD